MTNARMTNVAGGKCLSLLIRSLVIGLLLRLFSRLLGVVGRSIMDGLFIAQYGQLSSFVKSPGLFHIPMARCTFAMTAGVTHLQKENCRVNSSRD